MKRKHKVTNLQKRAVNLLISGEAKNPTQAMLKAGYAETSASEPSKRFLKSAGVQSYLKELDDKALQKFGMTIREKTLEVFADALEATKLYGKDAVEHPDHTVRLTAAERLAKYFGWDSSVQEEGSVHNQFNFFNVDAEKQKKFNDNLKSVIKKSYDDSNE